MAVEKSDKASFKLKLRCHTLITVLNVSSETRAPIGQCLSLLRLNFVMHSGDCNNIKVLLMSVPVALSCVEVSGGWVVLGADRLKMRTAAAIFS